MNRQATLTLPFLAVTALLFAPAHAAPKVDALPTAIAPVVAQAPAVDGVLSGPAWQQAAKLGPFVRIEGGAPKGETEALVLRSGDTLYVGVICRFDKGATLTVNQKTRDSDVFTDESVEVFIDPGMTLKKYRHFLINAANVQRDESGEIGATPPYDVAWNGVWASATSRDDTAWYAEFAIPFSDLGLQADAPATVGFNVCRNDSTRSESTCWSPTLSGFHEPTRFGLLGLPSPLAAGTPTAVSLPKVRIDGVDYGEARIGSFGEAVTLAAEATTAGLRGLSISGNADGRAETAFTVPSLTADAKAVVRVPYRIAEAGSNAVIAALTDAAGNPVALAKCAFGVPETQYEQYGYRLQGGDDLGLWWAEGTYKIHREKAIPEYTTDAVSISAAGREYEPVQIVLRPGKDIDARIAVSDFAGPGGKIAASNFALRRVAYVPVTIPTDSFGWAGDWPDPLPLIEGPVHCAAGVNQPIWVLAYVPPDTPRGVYKGQVTIEADGKTVAVPVRLRVWGFSLTKETHTSSAYGVGPDFGWHGVTDPAQKQQVFDLYMQSCRDHRIAPYGPTDLAPMEINTLAPMRKLTLGRMAIAFDRSQSSPWQLYWDGKLIASQQTSMTHFERLGVGYQGTGESWPYVNAIQSITEVSRTPGMRVFDIVAAHTGSDVAGRSFRMTLRLYVPAGDEWFALRLYKFEGTDATEIEARHYFNLPHTEFKADEVANGADFAAWSGALDAKSSKNLGFGMLCLDSAVSGLGVAKGAQGVTVCNSVTPFKMKKNEVRDGWGPLVVYFVSEKTAAADLQARADDLRKRIDIAHIDSYTPQKPVKVSEESRDDFRFTYDFTKFDAAAHRYLDGFGFNAFNMPCMPDQIGGYPRFTPEFKRLHKLMYAPVIAHLRQKGWLSKAYAYWYDEPSPDAFPYVAEGAQLLKEDCPGLARLITKEPEPGLIGPIDLWTPVLAAYNERSCHERQTLGERVWWYVCCGPRAPYPNNFIDHPALNHRIRFWMMEKYNVAGSLFWATTWYGTLPDGKPRNPWKCAMSYDPSGGCWGNGDGMLLYPPTEEPSSTPVVKGPVPSIRWEMLRKGMEDREYFWTLRQEVSRLEKLRPDASGARAKQIDTALAAAQKALDAPNRLAQSLVKYTRNPLDLLRERDGLAEAIEMCMRVK
jgi:hypothetical protein